MPQPATHPVTSRPPPVGRFHEVHGRRLLLHRSGDGNPPVVFIPGAGAGAVGLDYHHVQQLAAALTTSIVYDRAGTGWSDRVRLGRTAATVTDELRELLKTADVSAPYVLVGHSLGGLYARHHAQRFPEDVAGLVLLDPAHEDFDAYMPEELRAARPGRRSPLALGKEGLMRVGVRVMRWAVSHPVGRSLLLRVPAVRRYRAVYRGLFAGELAEWPGPIREALIERHVDVEQLWAGVEEVLNVEQLYDEVRRAPPTPDVPMVMLCSMDIDDFRRAVSPSQSPELLAEELDGKRRLYDAFTASLPRGENRPVDTGHFTMHLRRPEAVIDAIRDVLAGFARS